MGWGLKDYSCFYCTVEPAALRSGVWEFRNGSGHCGCNEDDVLEEQSLTLDALL